MQINLLYTMNYPLISEYVEAIKLAEDNFEELSYLRPVLDADGQPVMSSGNFAVVFKMKDERDGKLYAVRCFHRDQEGRADSYRLIEEELKDVESPYLVSFRYMDKELFVDSSQTGETEFPVLLMDWVEGITLDKYLRENLDDQYALEMLAYRFSQLAQWLIPQAFAHGDLKPDNILVREDGTIVLVDYDGMYVPTMKGQKARELGSPDFRHPLRTEDDFDEHIDDFPFVSILLALKAISINPQLLEKYGGSDRLLFSEKEYRNLSESKVMDALKTMMQDAELSSLYSLYILALSQNNLSQVSFRLFNLARPDEYQYEDDNLSTEVTDEDLDNAWADEYGALYSADKKRFLQAPENVTIEEYTIREGTKVICDYAYYSHSHPVLVELGRTKFARNFKEGTSLTTIHIPDSVVCIGQGAFAGCKLTSISLPNGIVSIGKRAFWACRNLTSIIIPYNVKYIGESAFLHCSGLQSIKVDVRNSIFDARDNCNAIIETQNNKLVLGCEKTSIPNSVTRIGVNAFNGCRSLRTIVIPSSVKSIDNQAFVGCVKLKEAIFLGNISYIAKDAFGRDVAFVSLNDPIEHENNVLLKKIRVSYYGNIINMIYVEGGSFYMGAQKNKISMPNYDIEAENDEGPVRETRVDSFWVSESLVTMDVWPWFSDNPNGVYPYNTRERSKDDCLYAVYGVTYKDCSEFIRGISKATNIKFDFPSEAEWEFAARGGIYSKGFKYSGSDTIEDVAIWGLEQDEYSIPLCPVKTKKPNELGLYDMSGGLYEWCKDAYSPNDFIDFNKHLKSHILGNPTIHVKRGGCITSNAHDCRITNRRRDNSFTILVDKERHTSYEGGDENYPSVNWWQVGLRLVARRINLDAVFDSTIPSYADRPSKEEIDNAIIDEFGVKYTKDGLKLISVPKEIVTYEIKQGVKIICHEAFSCSQIEKVSLPDSLLLIGGQAFCGCKNLKSIVIPNNVYRIGVQGFYSCESLCLINLSQSVNYIDDYGFSGCSSLCHIVIPENVDVLENNLFSFCKSLESVELPENLTKIGSNVFWNCKNLQSIMIPKNVNEIEDNPFRGSGITEVTCKTPLFVFENGFLMTADKKELVACLTRRKFVSIPSSIRLIRSHAFNGCETIVQVFLPETLTDIKEYAFSECASLSELMIPSSVRSIQRGFLADCPNFKRLVIHSKELWIDNNSAFYKAESLSQIIISQEIREEFASRFSEYSEIIEAY